MGASVVPAEVPAPVGRPAPVASRVLEASAEWLARAASAA